MSPETISLVKNSWSQLVPIADDAARLFYARLFALDPKLKSMFKGDMKEQGQKLTAMINTAVNYLDRLETILPAVQELGKRHVDYAVADEHYNTVGSALLWTLEQGLGESFTPEVSAAWTEVYTALARVMKEAAAEQTA